MVIVALIDALKDDSLLFAICAALEQIGPSASHAVPVLEPRLKDKDEEVKKAVYKALEAIKKRNQ